MDKLVLIKAMKIYNELNDNEKFGLCFGLFPVRLMDLDKDTAVELIKIAQKEHNLYL